MKKKLLLSGILSFSLVLASYLIVSAWGTWGHQHINRAAVFALPETMRPFFYNHIDFITEESVVPDIRKYTINDRPEFARHYIDVEAYASDVNSIPHTMKDALKKHDSLYLQKNGILPWYIGEMMQKLTKAFANKSKTEILFLAADLGHYLADANMPLHTTLNHNGQLTGQTGIHSFWESQLPELFGETYNLHIREAKYIEDVENETWNIIRQSHSLCDTLLAIDRNLKKTFAENEIYVHDSQGKIVKNKYNQAVFTYAYASAFHKALNGMVENQMRTAIENIADFWYTAWVNAGKPDLTNIDPASLTKENKKRLKKDMLVWKKGKVTGLKTDKEY